MHIPTSGYLQKSHTFKKLCLSSAQKLKQTPSVQFTVHFILFVDPKFACKVNDGHLHHCGINFEMEL